jgi:hypothetical protein
MLATVPTPSSAALAGESLKKKKKKRKTTKEDAPENIKPSLEAFPANSLTDTVQAEKDKREEASPINLPLPEVLAITPLLSPSTKDEAATPQAATNTPSDSTVVVDATKRSKKIFFK